MSPWLSDRLLGSQSDERLVALACAGSDRAFAAIVQRYRRPLQAFARRLDANGDADDLVQQTFLSALAAMRSGVEVRHLRGWLHQILRHAAIRTAREGELPCELGRGEPGAPSAQQTAELRLLALEALAALAQLPGRQQEAMVATAIQGRSRAEVAQLLGLSEGAVRQLVHRARESLRAAVTAITPYPLAQALAAGPSAGLANAVGGAGAGSAAVVALKVGALIASGVVATGVVSSGIGGAAHPARGVTSPSAARSAQASDPPVRPGAGTPIVQLGHRPHTDLEQGQAGTGDHRGGNSSHDGRSPGGPQTSSGDGVGGGGSGGSPGGPSATQASSSDGGGGGRTTTTSRSDGGGAGATTTTSGSGGGSGGSGSSDGGQTTTTTTTTTTSGSDGGSSGGSGSGGMTTTTSGS